VVASYAGDADPYKKPREDDDLDDGIDAVDEDEVDEDTA
jgi:ribosome-binding factor A